MNFELLNNQSGTDFQLYSVVWDPVANKPTSLRVQWSALSQRVLLSWDEGAPEQNGDGFRIYRSDSGGAFQLKAEVDYHTHAWSDPEEREYGQVYVYRVTEVRYFPEEIESEPAELHFYPVLNEESQEATAQRKAGIVRKYEEEENVFEVFRHSGETWDVIVTFSEYSKPRDRLGWRSTPEMRVLIGDAQTALDESERDAEYQRVGKEEAPVIATMAMPGGQGYYEYDHEPLDVTIHLDILPRRLRVERLVLGEEINA